MSRSDEPLRCPACRKPAPRALSLPNMSFLSDTTRRAHFRNEKSADQPEVATSIPEEGSHARRHARPGAKSKLKRSRHPWMIGH